MGILFKSCSFTPDKLISHCTEASFHTEKTSPHQSKLLSCTSSNVNSLNGKFMTRYYEGFIVRMGADAECVYVHSYRTEAA